MELKKIVSLAQYDYFSNLGIKFFAVKEKQKWGNHTMESTYIGPNQSDIKASVSNLISIKEISRDEHIYTRYYQNSNKYPSLDKDFFIDFFCKNPKFHNELFKDVFKYNGFSPKSDYKLLITKLIEHNLDPLKAISVFPIKQWEINVKNIKEFDDYLVNKHINETSLHNFWQKFIIKRKSQIKTTADAYEITEFLMEKYNGQESLLKPFFNDIPLLKSKFQQVELDVFEQEPRYTTSVLVNNKKLMKLLGLKNWDFSNYENTLSSMGYGFAKFYQCEAQIYHESKSKKTMRLCLIHNDEKINQDLIKENIKNFYYFLKTNQDYEISAQSVCKWMEQHQLQQALTNKKSETIKTKGFKI